MGKSKSKKELAPEPVSPMSDGAELTRPGTSGTENLLMTTTRQASEHYSKAQRAEKAYRAKKHATLARANYNETKAHFKDGFSNLWQGIKGIFSVLGSIPYLISEKRENRRRAADMKTRERNLERKRKLEEALAKEEGLEEEGKDKETATK
ncbi:hypothetical protein G7Z17_g652 [Cylindrodendrum hubeiense]|uniref:Uncharacterized protein n=1 Tax=Cylindrodendrum hubeiense TaxID=595255 RepID=A0A9P5LKV4_9HYPO|nr:hypothetical protein G7Z17_g652 [Cylindrodendrum hubeiense]